MTTGRRLCEVRQGSLWSPAGIPVQCRLPRLDLHRRRGRSTDVTAILEITPLVKGLRKHGTALAKRQDPLSLCDTYQIP